MRELIDFIKASLSNDKPESFNRTACAICLYFLLWWTTYIVSATKVIPDIPLQWAGLIASLYFGGKYLDTKKEIANAATNNQAAPATPQI